MSKDILQYLSGKFREEMRILEEDTVAGKAEDFGAYKYACGIYFGLLRANSIVADASRRIEEEYDD